MARIFTAFGVAGVTGSVLGGRVRDVFGSYAYAFTICGIMLLVGAVLAFLLKTPRRDLAPLPADLKPKAEPELASEIERVRSPFCRPPSLVNSLAPRTLRAIPCALAVLLLGLCQSQAAERCFIERVEPTPLFPRVEQGQALSQLATLHLTNAGPAIAVKARITLGTSTHTEDLGDVRVGKSTNTVHLPEIAAPTKLVVELVTKAGDDVLARSELNWQPQKKWKIYCVSYSHHDLGFGNYPHRLRTDIRHANIERPLKFCAETDGWDDDSKFRYVIETSEPITSFLGSHSEADAAELARRIREGRIQIGGMHNTANTEQMSYELMARLFYLTGRHTPDLLGVAPSRTAQIDDVIGLTWPLATYCSEAGVPYFFHGHNGVGQCLQPASAQPVFYWQGPDGREQGPGPLD